jgi:LysR family transcriptional regulator, low CO2-responsive transcriptional regulator
MTGVLSVAELTILRGLALGKTQAEIGEELHLEQSTISKTIKGIEERIGLAVAIVDGRRLKLNAAGNELAAAAERVLAAFDGLDAFARELKAGRAGSVRFITSSTPGSYVLPSIVAEFLRTHPQVSVDMEILPVSVLWQTFENERFDFAIAPIMGTPPELDVEPLYSDPVVFFTTPQARIAAQPSVTLEELAGETLVGKFVDSHWRRIFQELEDRGFRAQRKITIIPPEAVKAMVARGLGVGVLFESSIAAELEEGSLVRVPLAAAPLHEAFCVAATRGEPLLPAAEGLVAFIRAQLKHALKEYKPSFLEL